jgi:hypothetical protein
MDQATQMEQTGIWVGMQALTAFFIISMAVGLALCLHPIVRNSISSSRMYQPI